jgi:hypothetical protein
MRNLDSKTYLPGFHHFKFRFHGFVTETFSTVSVKSGEDDRDDAAAYVRFAPKRTIDRSLAKSALCQKRTNRSKKRCYSITSSASRTPIAVNSILKRRRWGLDRGETARPGGHRRIPDDGPSGRREAVLRIIPEPPRCERPTVAMTMIEEDADYGFDQTHHSGHGRRGDRDGRSVARVCAAVGTRRSCRALL